jgi:polyhydroxyalkanoate synthesis regulator phasin
MEKQKKWTRIMIGALLVLVLAIGGTAVFAQTQTQDDPPATPPVDDGSTDSTTPALPNPFSRGQRPDFDGRDGSAPTDDYLAEALGITAEELQAAQEAAQEAALEQAVADGTITQEQADQLSQFGGRMRGGHLGALGDMDEFLAAELGISVEALQAAQEEAQAAMLAQMVEDGVLTQEQADLMAARRAVESHVDVEGLNAAVQEAYAAAVQSALDAGEITQAQADQLLNEAAAAPSFRFNFGGHGRPGGHGHGGHGFPGAMPGTSTTTTTADSNA